MREVNRKFRDHYGKLIKAIRWERETNRVIYLREGYPHKYSSPPDQFQRGFREMKGNHGQ